MGHSDKECTVRVANALVAVEENDAESDENRQESRPFVGQLENHPPVNAARSVRPKKFIATPGEHLTGVRNRPATGCAL